MTSSGLIVADIGGTFARFRGGEVRGSDGCPGATVVLPCDDFSTPGALFGTAVTALGLDADPALAVIAGAGPVEAGAIEMVNRPWRLDAAAASRHLRAAEVVMLNDFEAIAHAVATATSGDWAAIGGGVETPGGTRVVLGPGTGLGVAAVTYDARDPDRYQVVSGEGGNVSFAPTTADELRLCAALQETHGRAFVEQLLSGPGLERLHAWRAHGRLQPLDRSAREIVTGALEGPGPDRDCVHAMLGCLGAVAGDLALTFGARGGVFVTGGVVQRLATLLPQSPLRARFEDKGRHAAYVGAIPTRRLLSEHPGLEGAWNFGQRALQGFAKRE